MVSVLVVLTVIAIVIQAVRFTVAFFTGNMTINGKRVGNAHRNYGRSRRG
jgi:hypothetical protein